MTPLESALGMVGFLTVLAVITRGLVWSLDAALDKLFGIWNPLEELDIDKDEL